MNPTLGSNQAALPAAGSILAGKYELVSVLGRGGMGIVYEARHLKLAQRVAIKLLRSEYLTDPKHVVRFEREARLAACLRGEHTVRIFDVDATPAGVPYMVMELLQGRDLADEVDARGDVPPSELLGWMRQICVAAHEAHQAGIIHRDLKPSNVFLCTAGGRTVAKVLDFGISKALRGNVGDVTTTATEDSGAGTPRYMSPEQVTGERDIDGRSDIWAIGVMMYRVLAGTYPFDGASDAQVAVAIANDSAVHLRVHRPDLPASLVAVVMKALAKRPRDRFASAEELARALEPFCDVAPVTSFVRSPAPPSSLSRSSHVSSLTSVTVRGLTSPTLPTISSPPPPARRPRRGLAGAALAALAMGALALPFVATRPHAAARSMAAVVAAPAASAAPIAPIAPVASVAPVAPSATPSATATATASSVASSASAQAATVAPASSPPSRKNVDRRPKSRPPQASPPKAVTPDQDDPLHL